MATIIGTRKTVLKVGGTDFTTHVSKCVIVSGDSEDDFISFAEALAGGARDYKLQLTIRQDTADDSLWYYAWDNAGDDVAVEFWPNGDGVTEGATTPKVTGTVTIVEPDGDFVGGEANRSNIATQVVEVEWAFTAKPTIDITP
jgi:hypothetical protein